MDQMSSGVAITDATVDEHAAEIRRLIARSARDIVEIGLRLLAVKAQLPHGAFLPWLGREFGWSQPTASRFMTVARAFGERLESIHGAYFDATALYSLASGATPPTVREEFVARAQAGERITGQLVQAALARPPSVTIGLLPDLTADEYADLKRSIRRFGVVHPVIVDQHEIVIDGHARVRAWTELRTEGVDLPVYPRTVKSFTSDEERILFAYEINTWRRHLTGAEAAVLRNQGAVIEHDRERAPDD